MFVLRRNIGLGFIFSIMIASFVSNVSAAGQLCFYLNSDREIESWNAFGDMGFYEDPNEFSGKDIIEVLPLSNEKKEKLRLAYDKAMQNNKKVSVTYEIETQTYVSKITPLKTGEMINFFVKVYEVEELFM